MELKSTEESVFQSNVKKYLEQLHIYVVKYNASALSKAGVPDILCCVHGIFCGIEIKTNSGVVSDLQKYNIKQIKKSGGIGFVLRPKSYYEFKRIFQNITIDENINKFKKEVLTLFETY